MFKSKYIKKLEERVAEFEDLLTNYLGSEIDGKVEVKDFIDFQNRVIGSKTVGMKNRYDFLGLYYTETPKTIFQEIEFLNNRFDKLEKYLGIKYVKEDKKIEEYRKVSKKQ